MSRIPLIVFGDGPRLRSGLARIGRDLTARLVIHQERLGIRVTQVGVDYPQGWHWPGWEFYGFQPQDRGDQGRLAVAQAVADLQLQEGEEPVVLMITDPARCYDITRTIHDFDQKDVEIDSERLWGYFPIDAHNVQGMVGGPAAVAVQTTQRILGYGHYGAGVLKATVGLARAVQYLPHGLEPGVFVPTALGHATPDFAVWAASHDDQTLKIGCVATNQPRKDLGLLFSSVAALKARGYRVALWLLTDRWTNAWDIGELAHAACLTKAEVFATVAEWTDQQLAAAYSWSDCTCAPGLGEGFGYPIVESLACGTPCVHGRYAGGVELIPDPNWLVDPYAWRLESCYVLQRPVFRPQDVADRLAHAAEQKQAEPQITTAFCTGSVEHLSWKHLWPRWESWIRQGLQAYRSEAASV